MATGEIVTRIEVGDGPPKEAQLSMSNLFDRIWSNRLTRVEAAYVAMAVDHVMSQHGPDFDEFARKVGSFGIETLSHVMTPVEDDDGQN
jgi:hypothetical protein